MTTRFIASTQIRGATGAAGAVFNVPVPAGVTDTHLCVIMAANASGYANPETLTAPAGFIARASKPAQANNSMWYVWTKLGGHAGGTNLGFTHSNTGSWQYYAVWYDTGGNDIAVAGPIGGRSGASSAITTIPSMTTTADGQEVIIVATERTINAGGISSISPTAPTQDLFYEDPNASGVTGTSGYIGRFSKPVAGPTGDISITYAEASGNGAGLMLAVATKKNAKTEKAVSGFDYWPDGWWAGGVTDVLNSRAAIPASNDYASQWASSQYDLTNSSVYAHVIPAMSGSNQSFFGVINTNDYTQYVEFAWMNDDELRWSMYNGEMSNTNLVTYDPVAHKYVRIRHAGGTTIAFDASPDAKAWTELDTLNAPFAMDSVEINFNSGYYDAAEPASKTMYIESVNCPSDPITIAFDGGLDGAVIPVQYPISEVGGSLKFSAAAKIHGSVGTTAVDNAGFIRVYKPISFVASGGSHTGSIYMRVKAIPTGGCRMVALLDNANSAIGYIRINTNGTFQLTDFNNTLIVSSSVKWVANQVFRIDWQYNSVGHNLTVKIFDNPESAVPVETLQGATGAGAKVFSRWMITPTISSGASNEINIDTIRLWDGIRSWPQPYIPNVGSVYRGLDKFTAPVEADPDTANYWLGTEFYVTDPSTLTEINFFLCKGHTTGTRRAAVYRIDSSSTFTLLTPVDTAGESLVTYTENRPGWNRIMLPTPINLVPNQKYKVVVQFIGGAYASTGGFFTATGPGANGIVDGPLVIPNHATATNGQATYAANATNVPAYPVGVSNAGNYWVTPGVVLNRKPEVYVYNGTAEVSGSLRVYDGTAEGAVKIPEIMPRGITVSQMSNPAYQPFFIAHRHGSRDWAEFSMRGATESVYRGMDGLEISLARTSDGVYFGLHDQYLNRTSPSAPANSDPELMTWAQVQAYQINVPAGGDPAFGAQPYMRLEELIDAYGSTHVIWIDPKYVDQARYPELLDIMESYSFGNDRFIGKYYCTNTKWGDDCHARGYKTWGFYYADDVNTANRVANTQASWDFIGMDYTATDADWNLLKSLLPAGKPIIGHIAPDIAGVNTSLRRGAVGVQTSGVRAVMGATGFVGRRPEYEGTGTVARWVAADLAKNDYYSHADGERVGTWKDRIGSYDLSGDYPNTNLAMPHFIKSSRINGRPAVRFSGSPTKHNLYASQSVTEEWNMPNSFTVAMVVRPVLGRDNLEQFFVYRGFEFIKFASEELQIWTDSGAESGTKLPEGPLNLMACASESGNDSAYLNGTQVINANVGAVLSSTQTSLEIGSWWGDDRYFTGDIAEVVVWDHILTPAERENWNNYVTRAYGIA